MNTLDLVLLAILFVLTVFGFVRGALRELLSLMIWCLAVGVAYFFSPTLLQQFPAMSFSDIGQAQEVAFFIIFFVVLFVGWIITFFLKQAMKLVPLGMWQRLFGAVFAGIHTVFWMIMIVRALQASTWVITQEWQLSIFIPYLEQLASLAPVLSAYADDLHTERG